MDNTNRLCFTLLTTALTDSRTCPFLMLIRFLRLAFYARSPCQWRIYNFSKEGQGAVGVEE